MIPRRKDNGNGKSKRRDQIPADLIPNDIYDRLDPEDIAKELFDMKPKGMSPAEWHWLVAFVDEYMEDLPPNPEYAYIRSGGQRKDARAAANILLKKPIVQVLIAKRRLEVTKRTNYNLDNVMKKLAAIVNFNLQDLYDKDGNPIPVHHLPREVAGALRALRVIKATDEDGNAVFHAIGDKCWNQLQALELAMRYHGALNDKVQIDVNEQRTLTLRLQVDQLRETYNPDELKQLHRLLARVPQAAASGTDATDDGLAQSARGGNGASRNVTPGVH